MAVLAALFLLWCLYLKDWPSRHALAALACYTASVVLFNAFIATDSLSYAFKVFNASINGALVMYLAVLFWFLFDPPSKDDLLAKASWLVVLVAEAWGLLFNNVGCNLLMEGDAQVLGWGVTASKYVCGREIGEWFEFMPLAAEIALLVWLWFRFSEARERLRNGTLGQDNSS